MKLNGKNIKIAVQKKGRLSELSLEVLKSSGVDFEIHQGRLFARCRKFPLDIIFLRDDDIPEYVQDGNADLGIVGQNVVAETGAIVSHLESFGFGRCELSIAVPRKSGLDTVEQLAGKRIATSYPSILLKYLESRKIPGVSIVEIHGSVEITPTMDVADAICDLVSTGSTLRLHELIPIETVMKSEAVLIANPDTLAEPWKNDLIERLRFRIKSYLRARKTKYVMMNAPEESLDRIKEVLPGMKSPTVLPLAQEGLIAIHTAVPEDEFWDVAEQLKGYGATDILVVPIEKLVL
jgi:ATP phosphoribosyltransferase